MEQNGLLFDRSTRPERYLSNGDVLLRPLPGNGTTTSSRIKKHLNFLPWKKSKNKGDTPSPGPVDHQRKFGSVSALSSSVLYRGLNPPFASTDASRIKHATVRCAGERVRAVVYPWETYSQPSSSRQETSAEPRKPAVGTFNPRTSRSRDNRFSSVRSSYGVFVPPPPPKRKSILPTKVNLYSLNEEYDAGPTNREKSRGRSPSSTTFIQSLNKLDPFSSVSSRKSILECDVTAYKLIKNHLSKSEENLDSDSDDDLSDNAVEERKKTPPSPTSGESESGIYSHTSSIRLGGQGMKLFPSDQSQASSIYSDSSKTNSVDSRSSTWSTGSTSDDGIYSLPEPDYDEMDCGTLRFKDLKLCYSPTLLRKADTQPSPPVAKAAPTVRRAASMVALPSSQKPTETRRVAEQENSVKVTQFNLPSDVEEYQSGDRAEQDDSVNLLHSLKPHVSTEVKSILKKTMDSEYGAVGRSEHVSHLEDVIKEVKQKKRVKFKSLSSENLDATERIEPDLSSFSDDDSWKEEEGSGETVKKNDTTSLEADDGFRTVDEVLSSGGLSSIPFPVERISQGTISSRYSASIPSKTVVRPSQPPPPPPVPCTLPPLPPPRPISARSVSCNDLRNSGANNGPRFSVVRIARRPQGKLPAPVLAGKDPPRPISFDTRKSKESEDQGRKDVPKNGSPSPATKPVPRGKTAAETSGSQQEAQRRRIAVSKGQSSYGVSLAVPVIPERDAQWLPSGHPYFAAPPKHTSQNVRTLRSQHEISPRVSQDNFTAGNKRNGTECEEQNIYQNIVVSISNNASQNTPVCETTSPAESPASNQKATYLKQSDSITCTITTSDHRTRHGCCDESWSRGDISHVPEPSKTTLPTDTEDTLFLSQTQHKVEPFQSRLGREADVPKQYSTPSAKEEDNSVYAATRALFQSYQSKPEDENFCETYTDGRRTVVTIGFPIDGDEHIYTSVTSDSIYEEVPFTCNKSQSKASPSVDSSWKSWFEGASKAEILNYLQNARQRVVDHVNEDYNDTLILENTKTSLRNTRNRISNISNSSESSTLSESSASPDEMRPEYVTPPVKYGRLSSAEVERNDSGVGTETSKPPRLRRLDKSNDTEQLCADCDQQVEPFANEISSIFLWPLVCKKCNKKRSERKEIITEVVETEFKYGRDLLVIKEEFCCPMNVAGLLTKEQLSGVFLNLDELITVNSKFSEKLKDAADIAVEQGDEDYTTVNIGKLFLESTAMLHAFESYCIRQGSASLLLSNLEKEKELLRIFLRVSQMENTLLRRMNLSAFLMVPVQRVTKYPLLLNRLYKVTPYHHQDRETLREAQLKIELHLDHINQQTKGSSGAKIWRKISNISATHRRIMAVSDIGSIKLRKMALEVLKWSREEIRFVMAGRLLYTPVVDLSRSRKGRTVKFGTIHALLAALGKPNTNYRPDLINDNSILFPRNSGIKDATLLLVKEKNGRFTLAREPLHLGRCVISSEETTDESIEIQEYTSKESIILKAECRSETKEWLHQLRYHAKDLGTWRRRRNALANIMINGMTRH